MFYSLSGLTRLLIVNSAASFVFASLLMTVMENDFVNPGTLLMLLLGGFMSIFAVALVASDMVTRLPPLWMQAKSIAKQRAKIDE
jgi:hypothetical protein